MNSTSQTYHFPEDAPLHLENGFVLKGAHVAYATFGALNADKTNAVLVCHALTGDQYATGENPKLGRQGWWSKVVGDGCPIDTTRYFVICANTLASCYGSSGPSDINPETGKVYGIDFPFVSIGDMVEAQYRLARSFGIEKLLAVVGGSAGGMQVLEFVRKYGDYFHAAVPIATTAQESPRNIALHEVSRQAIMADPDWLHGGYAEQGKIPALGLRIARMSSHVNYMSPEKILQRFGRSPSRPGDAKMFYKPDFEIEDYLHHQGVSFKNRFDANSYLYLSKALDMFDLASGQEGLVGVFRKTKARFCVIAFSSDWLQPPEESRKIVRALTMCNADVSFVVITTDNGHDAFLLDEPEMFSVIRGFIDATYRLRVEGGSPAKAAVGS